MWQTFRFTKMSEASACHAGQPIAIAPNPQTSVGRRAEGGDPAAFQFGWGGFIESDEVESIKAHEALLCSNPQIALGALGNGPDGVMGQTIVGLPDAHAVSGDRISGSRGGENRCGKQDGSNCRAQGSRRFKPAFLE